MRIQPLSVTLNYMNISQKQKHWALTYLSQWDDADDEYLFQPTKLLLHVHAELQAKAANVEAAFEEAAKGVKHLQEKAELTEDEYNELEGAVGWFDDAVAEYQSHRDVIAESILIAMSTMVKTRAKAGHSLLAQYGKGKKYYLEDLLSLGPKVKGVSWANGVYVGGNYVRHRDEWRVFPYEKVKLENGDSAMRRTTEDLVSLLKTDFQKANAKIVSDLGIPQKDFLEHSRNVSHEIAKKLDLYNVSGFAPLFHTWREEMIAFVKATIGA